MEREHMALGEEWEEDVEPAGQQAVQVTTMFGDSVIGVHYRVDPASGRAKPFTWLVLSLGWTLALAGGLAVLLGQLGLAAPPLLLGVALAIYGNLRRNEEKRSPHFTLGESRRASFPLSGSLLPSSNFPLLRSTGTGYQLLFTENMDGEVVAGPLRFALKDLVRTGRARPVDELAQTYVYPLSPRTQSRVAIGLNTFFIDWVQAAQPFSRSLFSQVNWPAQVANSLSFTLHALVLLLVFSLPPDARALSYDFFNTDGRQVRILFKPPVMQQDETHWWLQRRRPEDSAAGKKAKGPEGKMGSPRSKQTGRRVAIKGPAQNPDPHLAKILAQDTAQKMVFNSLLKGSSGSHLASIFGRSSALGTDAENALGNLIGNQIGEAYGVNGLGIIGSGRSGGSTADGYIGTSSLGRIGFGLNNNPGERVALSKNLKPGDHKAGVPVVTPIRLQVSAGYDKELIRREIRRHLNEVKYCYQRELQARPELNGRVVVHFTIAPTGQVIGSKVQQSTLNSTDAETCIAQAFFRWVFPKPQHLGIVQVIYPFVFRSAGEGL